MAKKIYYRLVIPIDAKEHKAISAEAKRLCFKNVHRWAAMKMARELRLVVTGPQK